MKILLKVPNSPDKIIEGEFNFEIIQKRMDKVGGTATILGNTLATAPTHTLEKIINNNPYIPPSIPPTRKIPQIPVATTSTTKTGRLSIAEGMTIVKQIRDKYFPKKLKERKRSSFYFCFSTNPKIESTETYPITDIAVKFMNYRSKNRLGQADYKNKLLTLSTSLLNNPLRLKQVVYHEYTHFEFPNDGHRGWGFRSKEYGNPYREKRTRRLSCIS